jgi:hypothetical protein
MKKTIFSVLLIMSTDLYAYNEFAGHDVAARPFNLQAGDPAIAHTSAQVMRFCDFTKQIVVADPKDPEYICIYNGAPTS